jgi:hypothetical protein
MNCPHSKIEAALDRWSECHWHIHQMEVNYHEPDPFRYSLNSFIRSIKEIPQILQMELQNDSSYLIKFKPLIDELLKNDLFKELNKHRNFIVHRGMLDILSNGQVGTAEGGRIKIAFKFNIAPNESSNDAYERYKKICRSDSVIRGMIGPDCDSVPCVWREWRIEKFPETELLDLAISAWRVIGEVLSKIIVVLGGDEIDLNFTCRHDPEKVKMKRFSQSDFFS